MKKLNQIKLNNLSQEDLEDRKMNALHGGNDCGCGCNNGGSGGVYGGNRAPGMP